MIKDLPCLDKPREKALNIGVELLSDAELLAILIRTGTKNNSALDIAYKIINEFGYLNENIITFERLSKIKGLGETKAITILSALELGKRSLKNNIQKVKVNNAKDIFNCFKYYFYNKKQEILLIVFLDSKKAIISYKQIYIGTTNHLSINQKDIFKETIIHSSSNIILVHNHPNGSVFPSKEDIKTTNNIVCLGNLLEINVLDHIIITNNNYYSFLENGDIK